MVTESSKYHYDDVPNWLKLPEHWQVREMSGVAIDSQDRVFALGRGHNPVAIFDSDGNFIDAWGADLFKRAHNIMIAPDDIVYCVDDLGHRIFKFAPDGELLLTINSQNTHVDNPAITGRGQTGSTVHPPFNYPTGIALSPEGDLYISDGYGNARIHKYASDGTYLFSWGGFGTETGQFHVPHGVFVDDDGLVYISDRMNQRIQIFTGDGDFVTQWDDVHWPDNICMDKDGTIYVAELGGLYLKGLPMDMSQPSARITIRNQQGHILAEWYPPDPLGTGSFFAPHDIAVDSKGNLYIAEAAATYARGTAPPSWPLLRKLVLNSRSHI